MKVFRTILFTLLFIAAGYLYYNNYTLKQENEYLSQRIENLEDYTQNMADKINNFHASLYASHDPIGKQGTHFLYISDQYYNDNFKKVE